MDATHPLSRAIAAAGGASAFRIAVGISPRTLATWRKEGVPDTRWSDVAGASAGSVTAEDLALHRAGLLAAREAA
jgi:DNA-binding transcriptional regulator YdaS (Cro superfamily)